MAIQWGNTSGYFRLGIDATVSGGLATIVVYGQSVGYGHNWTYTLNLSGDWYGSQNVSFYSGSGQTVTKELFRLTQTFTGTRNFGANISYWNGSSSVTRTVTISSTSSSPTAPLGVKVIDVTHREDGSASIKLQWSRPTTYSKVNIYGHTWYNNQRDYRLLKTISGNAWSGTFDTPPGFESYQFKVTGVTSGGESGYSNQTGWVYTRPPEVTGLRAERVNDTTTKVHWDDLGVKEFVFDIARNNQISGRTVKGNAPVTSYTDTGLSNSTYNYRVRAGVENWDGNITWGPWTGYSNSVSTLQPPLTPTNLEPQGGYYEAGKPVTVLWVHNPQDGSTQEAYILGYQHENSGSPSSVTRAGAGSSHTLTLLTGGMWRWLVKTKGRAAQYSPRGTGYFYIVPKPTVAITSPAASSQYRSSRVTVSWAYTRPTGTSYAQEQYRVELVKNGAVIESKDGTGAATSYRFTTRLDNKSTYTLHVKVATKGVWLNTATRQLTTAFYTPQNAIVTGAEFFDIDGSLEISFRLGTGQANALRVELWRAYSRQGPYQFVQYCYPLMQDPILTDSYARTNGVTYYKLVAISAEGATVSTYYESNLESDYVYLTQAATLIPETVRMRYNPEVQVSWVKDRTSVAYAGRALPVAYTSINQHRTIQAGGVLVKGDEETLSVEQVGQLAQSAAPLFCYRDPDGRVVYGVLSEFQATRQGAYLFKWLFTLSETETGSWFGEGQSDD